MKKSLLIVLSIIFIAFAFIFGIRFFQNDNENGFRRNIKAAELKFVNVFRLPPALFYFAGGSATVLYLKDLHNSAAYLYSIDYELSSFKSVDLKLSEKTAFDKQTVNVGLTDTAFFITKNQSGELTVISKKNHKNYTFKNPGIYIDQTNLIAEDVVVGRSILIEENGPKMKLIKVNYKPGRVAQEFKVEKQKDCFLCADGMLRYDQEKSRLFYMYYYSGEILCLDTNLNLLYRSKTIDTVKIADVKMSKVNKKDMKTEVSQAKPPKMVNKNFIIYSGCLYVLSVLKADNEAKSMLSRSQVVDVYTAENGKYLYSFYIPKYQGKRLQDFRIKGDLIYGIFDSYLAVYKLPRQMG